MDRNKEGFTELCKRRDFTCIVLYDLSGIFMIINLPTIFSPLVWNYPLLYWLLCSAPKGGLIYTSYEFFAF